MLLVFVKVLLSFFFSISNEVKNIRLCLHLVEKLQHESYIIVRIRVSCLKTLEADIFE